MQIAATKIACMHTKMVFMPQITVKNLAFLLQITATKMAFMLKVPAANMELDCQFSNKDSDPAIDYIK